MSLIKKIFGIDDEVIPELDSLQLEEQKKLGEDVTGKIVHLIQDKVLPEYLLMVDPKEKNDDNSYTIHVYCRKSQNASLSGKSNDIALATAKIKIWKKNEELEVQGHHGRFTAIRRFPREKMIDFIDIIKNLIVSYPG